MRLAGCPLILILSGLLARPVLAQDPPDDAPAEAASDEAQPPEDVPPEPPPRAVPWSDAYQWRSLDFRRPARSMATNSRGQLIVLDDDGTVYVNEGRGLWATTLGGNLSLEQDINEEDLLLDAESAVEDFTDTSSQGSGSLDDDVDVEDEIPAGEADLSDSIDMGILDADERFAGLNRTPETVWASQRIPGLVLVSRRGGTHRSTNDGLSWRSVDDLPPTFDFVEVPGTGVILAATTKGLYGSLDRGVTWAEGDPGLRDVTIFDLEVGGALLYAATADGLWQSIDGGRWGKLLPPRYADLAMLSVSADASWTGGLWVASVEEGILRSDDAGQTFRPTGRNPLIGTAELAPLSDAPGHVLAAGSDGVWESTDGGVRWLPLSDGLPGPDITDLLAEDGQRPVIATPAGIFELRRPEQLTLESDSGDQGGLTVSDTVDMALRRAGINTDPFSVQRRFTRALLTPRLRLQGEYQPDDFINVDYDGVRTTRMTESDWRFSVDLCFGACSVSSSLITDIDGGFDNPELAVIGGEVYQADDAISTVAPAAANVVQRLSQYRGDVAGYVTDLYFTRERLLGEQEGVAGLPLTEQVLFALELQEVVARLDIYTDGRYSASLQSP